MRLANYKYLVAMSIVVLLLFAIIVFTKNQNNSGQQELKPTVSLQPTAPENERYRLSWQTAEDGYTRLEIGNKQDASLSRTITLSCLPRNFSFSPQYRYLAFICRYPNSSEEIVNDVYTYDLKNFILQNQSNVLDKDLPQDLIKDTCEGDGYWNRYFSEDLTPAWSENYDLLIGELSINDCTAEQSYLTIYRYSLLLTNPISPIYKSSLQPLANYKQIVVTDQRTAQLITTTETIPFNF